MQWCCLSRRTTLCTGPPRTLWMLGSAWEVDPRRLAVITHLTTSRCERERKWEEDNRVDMSSERSRTPGKNECVGVCLPVFVYESGGRAGVHFGGASHDCHRESTANRLLMWRTWFKKKKNERKKINSVETLHPLVHKAPPVSQRPRKRLCNRHLYVSKSLCTPPTTSTAAWTLQWQHMSTRGSSFPGGQSGAAHHWSGFSCTCRINNSTAVNVTWGDNRSSRLLIFIVFFGELLGERCSVASGDFNELSKTLSHHNGYPAWSCWKWTFNRKDKSFSACLFHCHLLTLIYLFFLLDTEQYCFFVGTTVLNC